jgi:prolipoprotein diacylglyceryltransferase
MYWLWNPDPVAIVIGGFGVTWYGLLFALGFLFAQRLVIFIYHKEGKPDRNLEALLIYLIVGTVAGARIGHCLFYDPVYYLHNPVTILRIWEGGLASHGAAAGILTALLIYSRRKHNQRFIWLVDRIAIVAALVGGLVRLGNFINSEIVGSPTRTSCGVVFAAPIRDAILESDPLVAVTGIGRMMGSGQMPPGIVPLRITLSSSQPAPSAEQRGLLLQRVRTGLLASRAARMHIREGELPVVSLPEYADATAMTLAIAAIARHPVQLYEACACLTLAVVLFLVWWRQRSRLSHGLLFGWFLVVIFMSRFFLEHFKETAAVGESGLPLTIGQLLSLPFILAGLWLLLTRRNLFQVDK